jgi:hypothetical protein
MKVENMLGYKIFKETDDGIEMYRIIKVKKYPQGGSPSTMTVKNLDTDEEKVVRVEDMKDFVPLTPDAYLTFNKVHILNGKEVLEDVVITASKILNLKVGDTVPYAVCRQSCTDIFYNLICKDESDMIVGLSVNQDDCPTNFDFRAILACDGVDKSQYVNYYRMDTLEDVMPMIKTHGLNKVMESNYMKHVKAVGDTSIAFKKEDRGWCKDIDTLMKENSFQSDIDQMLGITAVNFKIEDYIIKKNLTEDQEYETFTDDLVLWLKNLYRVNINKLNVVKYDYDIDLAEFNNARYFLLRDNTKTLYLCVYTIDNDELEIDLAEKANELDISTKFILDFYNKYNRYNKDNNNQE